MGLRASASITALLFVSSSFASYSEAKALYLAGQYALAIEACAQIPANSEDAVRGQYVKASALLAEGKMLDAQAAFKQIAASLPQAKMALARIAYHNGELNEALRLYGLVSSPELQAVRDFEMSLTLIRLGKLSKAEKNLEKLDQHYAALLSQHPVTDPWLLVRMRQQKELVQVGQVGDTIRVLEGEIHVQLAQNRSLLEKAKKLFPVERIPHPHTQTVLHVRQILDKLEHETRTEVYRLEQISHALTELEHETQRALAHQKQLTAQALGIEIDAARAKIAEALVEVALHEQKNTAAKLEAVESDKQLALTRVRQLSQEVTNEVAP